MDAKTRKKHNITLTEIKKAAEFIVGKNEFIACSIRLEKDKFSGTNLYHFKLVLSVPSKNRTQVKQYIYYADTKKGLIINMLNLKNIDEFEYFFDPICFG